MLFMCWLTPKSMLAHKLTLTFYVRVCVCTQAGEANLRNQMPDARRPTDLTAKIRNMVNKLYIIYRSNVYTYIYKQS